MTQQPNNNQPQPQYLLERLQDINLLDFEPVEGSPSSGIASLPTPLGDLHPLEDEPARVPADTPLHPWFAPLVESIQPNAPLMKDYDSFTDGSGHGSFDSIPAVGVNELGEVIEPINCLLLSMIPPINTSLHIQQWREDVCQNTSPIATYQPPPQPQPPVKRPRSPTSDHGRRTRPRPVSLCSANSLRNSFEWPMVPSEALRPPSRANTAPD